MHNAMEAVMKALRWLVVPLAALTASVVHADPKGEAAIVAHGKQWSALYAAGRIDEMRTLYEPDAWLMTEGAPAAKGVDAILDYLRRNKATGNRVDFSFVPELITIDGPRAYLISKYWMVVDTSANKRIEAAGRSFLVFKRGKDGKWRIWRDMDNRAADVLFADRPKS
jgi:ketosteroid isomerase-like protein